MRRNEKYPRPVRIVTTKRLHSVWKDCRDATDKGGAPGIDHVSPQRFRENLDTNINKIREQILRGEYKFANLKPHPILKDSGKHRIICIPAVRDRLVQRLILQHLTRPKDLLGVINETSYGVARGKEQGTHAAVDKTVKLRKEKPWILKTDISAFFDNIPRQHLIGLVRTRLKRHSLVPLLEQIISSEVDERDKEKKEIVSKNGIKRGKGLRQGMPLSPLLSNLVLRSFDKKLAKQGIKVVRYVDDLIVLANSEEECLAAKELIEKELKRVELTIPDLGAVNSKTEIKKPDESVIFLGFEIYKMKNGEYAKRIPDEAVAEAYAKVAKAGSYEYCIGKERKSLTSVLSWLENIPVGYKASYSGATNLDTFLGEITKRTDAVKKALLEDIFGKEAVAKLSNDKLKFLGFLRD